MRRALRRPILATVLVAAAVLIPSAAWYVGGARGVRKDIATVQQDALARVQDGAELDALRVATRLGNLTESETGRPHTHWVHAWTEDDESCACPVPRRSPLATGAPDALIELYFRVDEDGRLTSPTIEGTAMALDLLRPAAGELLAVLAVAPANDEVLEPTAAPTEPAPSPGSEPAVDGSRLIAQGPFRWRTVAVDGLPTLVAIREVVTTDGRYGQGFVISTERLEREVAGADRAFRLIHGSATAAGEADVPIAGTAWRVVVDPTAVMNAAVAVATEVERRFVRSYRLGVLAALVAGGLVIGLVWQAERVAAARGRFAAAAAHELRSPLASLRLHGELLGESLGRPENVRHSARAIADEVERLGRVVGNILGYARLERGGIVLRPDAGDLGDTVTATVERMRPAVEASGGLLDTSIEAGVPPARFDADAMHHVVQNLIDNAVRHAADARDRTVTVQVASTPGGVVLTVRDRGPGLPASIRRSVERGRPPGAGTGRDAGGLGLGLYLVSTLVRAMDATLRYTDAPDGGACFEVTVPAERDLVIDAPDAR